MNDDVRQFRDSVELESAGTDELIAQMGVRALWWGVWTSDVRAEFRSWGEPARSGTPTATGIGLTLSRSTLGRRARFELDALVNTDYQRVSLELTGPYSIRLTEISPSLRAGWGTPNLPAQHTFAFGGIDGFAGYVVGERRGTHDVVGSLKMTRPVFGPIRGHLEVQAGATGRGHGFGGVGRDPTASYLGRWSTGVRVGMEVRTPSLDLILAQGYNRDGRSQGFVRIGRWF